MSHPTIPTRLSAALGAIVLVAMTQFAEAQTPTNAALQARARMQQRHKQTGSIGNGYRPYSAWTYQNSARTHAQALNAYGQNCKQLPPATAKEHLDAIRQNVTATKTEIAKLGPEAAKEADVKQHVDALEKHLAECEKLCGMMEKTISQDGVETVQMCAHCSGLEQKLKAAETEHRALLKKLSIEPPAPAHDHGEHLPQKAEESGATN
jgi:cytochrome c556